MLVDPDLTRVSGYKPKKYDQEEILLCNACKWGMDKNLQQARKHGHEVSF